MSVELRLLLFAAISVDDTLLKKRQFVNATDEQGNFIFVYIVVLLLALTENRLLCRQ